MPPLSAPTTTTVGFAMVDPPFTLRYYIPGPSGSAPGRKPRAKARNVAPVSPQVAFTHPGEFLEGGSSACLLAPGGRLWRHCGSAAMRPPGPGVGVVGWRRRPRWRQRSSVVALAGAVAGRRSPGALSRSLLAVGGFRFRACLLVLASWRRQGDRAGIMAAGELHQRRDPALDRR